MSKGLVGFGAATMLAHVAICTPADASDSHRSSFFVGHWRVTGVAVSNIGVQALVENDPSLMGKTLTITKAQLAWDRPPQTGDVCIEPHFTKLTSSAVAGLRPELDKLNLKRPSAYSIYCRSGKWGPGANAIVFRGTGGALAMPWYDGGLLKLGRNKLSFSPTTAVRP